MFISQFCTTRNVLVFSALILASFFFGLSPWRGPNAAGTAVAFATITVTTTADTVNSEGFCSLREAILSANGINQNSDCQPGTAGLDTIQFNLGPGTPTITVLSELPQITEPLIIDGATGDSTRVELNGTSAGPTANGLKITAANSTIKSLVINRFSQVGIQLLTGGGNTIQDCYIGTNAAGTAAQANNNNGISCQSSNNVIGGTTVAARNLISGNNNDGIEISTGANNNLIQGNYIGTNAAGTAALANSGNGVFVNGGTSNTIGGSAAGASNLLSGNNAAGINLSNANNNQVLGNLIGVNATGAAALPNNLGITLANATGNTIGGLTTAARNVISGNTTRGLRFEFSATDNLVQGNFIGTNAAGTAALGNGTGGVFVDSSPNNTLGGTATGARNLISGNLGNGIELKTVNNTTVQGNLIGTDVNGTAALGNLGRGVSVVNSPNNTIGGTAAGTGNLVSGNGDDGIAVESLTPNAANGNTVQGNFVGVNAAGTAALANADNGIAILSANNCIIGGTAAGAGNLVSGNGDDGIEISGTSGGNNNQVQGNRIGVNASGMGALGNTVDGVHIFDNASGNTIGGFLAGAGNLIANNGNNGVTIDSPTAINNALLGNAIFDNAQLGIDLSGDGPTANDAGDADTGANTLQNFPVLTAAIVVGGNTTMLGTFNSTANTAFRIEFFSSPTCDGSGNGEGRVFLGFTNVMTDGVGNATINTTLAVAVPPGELITATATNPANNTSEFSPCSAVTTCPTIIVYPSNPTLTSGQAGQLYTQPLTQTDGNGAITWSVSAGSLPNGLTLNAITGVLSGTPVVFGTFNFTIRATDALTCTGERAYSLTINNVCATIAPANQSFAAAGGSGTVNVTGSGSCNWTAMSNAPWITVTGGGSGTGNGTVSYTVAASASASPRTGTLTIAGRTFYVNQSVPGLILSEDFEGGIPSTWTVVDGGIGGGANAAWKSVQSADFCPSSANPLPAPFAGFVALANGSPSCVGTGSVQDEQLITPSFNATGLGRVLLQFLNQFRLDPSAGPTHTGDVDVSLDGGLNWINVLHQIVDDGFPTPTLKTLDITSVVAANPANVRIRFHYFGQMPSLNRPTGGGEVIWPIDACHISFLSISPTSQNFNASGGPGSVTVTVPAGESWTAQSNDAWLTAVTPGGTGSGTANYTVAPNLGATPRSGTLTIAGNTFTVNQTANNNGLQFYPLAAPVRALETRAPFSGCVNPGAPISAGSSFTLAVRTGCTGIPANAVAVTGNVTVVPGAAGGFLTLFPSSATQPIVANSNFKPGEVTNNVFTTGLGASDGAFKIFASATTEVIVDITGYYAPPAANGLYFHPLPEPVRLVETRTLAGLTGCIKPGAPLAAGQDFAVQGRSPVAAPCNAIPAAAQVLVGNATSVFPAGGGFLTIFPSDATRPLIASSNYAGADIINGPFAVKLGADGQFKVFTPTTTELVIDILGYYSSEASDANGAGLLFNPLDKPVRLLETRPDPGFPLTGCYRPNAKITGGTGGIRTQQSWGTCEGLTIPNSARALIGNATVVNVDGAGFLTFYPGNVATAPTVATSNYPAPVVFGYNRHFVVGVSPTDGTFKILTQATTDLIVDVAGFFAP